MGRVRGLWGEYWPLAVLPGAAAAMDLGLWGLGEPWTWADWAGNFGLGAVTTMVVGMLLARRQGRIQEALADLELTEKVGYLTFSVGRLREDCAPDRVRRALYDCRAGLALVPLARRPMREEYLRTVTRVLEVSAETLGTSLRARAQWADGDWADLAELAGELCRAAPAAAPGPGSAAVTAGAGKLLRTAADPVPFDVFRAHFTAGPDRIRTALDWRGLAERAGRGDGTVALSVVRTDLAPYRLGALRDCYAPWYADAAGTGEARHDDPGAVPLRHADLASDCSVLGDARRDRIAELRAHYATQLTGEGVSLILATYALGAGRRLVLDGNHRLTAIAQLVAAGCPARLVEFRLTAPLDPAILPDLSHHPRG